MLGVAVWETESFSETNRRFSGPPPESQGSSSMEGGGGCRRPEWEEERSEEENSDVEDYYDGGDGVIRARLIRGSKHRDGSIYRQDAHWIHRLYRLRDTSETVLEPTNNSFMDMTPCLPHRSYCTSHNGCAMMQIFSLKLVNFSPATTNPAAPIEIYGFMAVRDLLDPFRNYIFNRTRDDPLVIHLHSDDPSSQLLIQMSGPKRGIFFQARALIEFDLRIKRAQTEENDSEDLELIDGAVTFSELTPYHGVYTRRIRGNSGCVDISLALLRQSVEARIELWISHLPANGISLSATCVVSDLPEEIKLFDGVVDKPGHLSFVVAVVIRTPLLLDFRAKQVGGSGNVQKYSPGFPAQAHGCNYTWLRFDFGKIEMKISWANLLH